MPHLFPALRLRREGSGGEGGGERESAHAGVEAAGLFLRADEEGVLLSSLFFDILPEPVALL